LSLQSKQHHYPQIFFWVDQPPIRAVPHFTESRHEDRDFKKRGGILGALRFFRGSVALSKSVGKRGNIRKSEPQGQILMTTNTAHFTARIRESQQAVCTADGIRILTPSRSMADRNAENRKSCAPPSPESCGEIASDTRAGLHVPKPQMGGGR
jgi:hypothetical protein